MCTYACTNTRQPGKTQKISAEVTLEFGMTSQLLIQLLHSTYKLEPLCGLLFVWLLISKAKNRELHAELITQETGNHQSFPTAAEDNVIFFFFSSQFEIVIKINKWKPSDKKLCLWEPLSIQQMTITSLDTQLFYQYMVIIILSIHGHHNSASDIAQSPLCLSLQIFIESLTMWLAMWGMLGFNRSIFTGLLELKFWWKLTQRMSYMHTHADACILEHHCHGEHTGSCWKIMEQRWRH